MADLHYLARFLLKTRFAKVLFSGCLFFALFGGGFWNLLDLPDSPSNTVLDTLMVIVFVLFCIELVLNLLADRLYFGSFFFLMDVLGTISMIFEMSFLLGSAGKENSNRTAVDPVFMRTARVAKTAARAGRFLKLTKCLDVIVKRRRLEVVHDTAQKLSQKLMLALSSKVSLLTIVMVIVIPLFSIGQYPEEDLSMKAWGQRLETSYARSVAELLANPQQQQSGNFAATVEEFIEFYTQVSYYPYQLVGYPEELVVSGRTLKIPGASLVMAETPDRAQNVVRQEVSVCKVQRPGCDGAAKAAAYWNFNDSKRLESGTDMLMSVCVILIMVALTTNLTSTIDRLVVKPMERILSMVRNVSLNIIHLTTEDDKVHEADDEHDETKLLECVFDRLSRITCIVLSDRIVDTDGLTLEAKGVYMDMMGMEARNSGSGFQTRRKAMISQIDSPKARVAELSCPASVVDSWQLDLLTTTGDFDQIVLYMFFDSTLGPSLGHAFTDQSTFSAFYNAVMATYQALPYHNATHAVDVTHCVYRLLQLTRAREWCRDVELFALMVAALCHDMGHPGRTNQFLVETRSELALLYNDSSPLENMHCSQLFKLVAGETTNVFRNLSTDDYKRARAVAIKTILVTDNVHHFDVVKSIKKIYEVNCDVIDMQHDLGEDAPYCDEFQVDILQKESGKLLEFFLHLADISNPLKPFELCRAWAWRVMDEFFNQGDEEKKLGIPVGMLNDRDKVDRPGSQHGFLALLVAPLVFCSVKVFPVLNPLATQMAENVREWRNVWVDQMKPTDEAIAKRDAEVDRIVAQAAELRTWFVNMQVQVHKGSELDW